MTEEVDGRITKYSGRFAEDRSLNGVVFAVIEAEEIFAKIRFNFGKPDFDDACVVYKTKKAMFKGTARADFLPEDAVGDMFYYREEFGEGYGEESNPCINNAFRRHDEKYDGMFQNGVRSGKGKLVDKDDKMIFDGTFSEDLYSEGVLTRRIDSSSYFTYDGKFDAGKFAGVNGGTMKIFDNDNNLKIAFKGKFDDNE